ncbi:sigma-70 family RNA polymerase sigma factor [Granulosicoccus antarcticus]|uniref:ECF RNA polymerase sigma factor SigK n=1 Tax=Granulosicoccus antarcticus IMCC3135 TaxID=1192854 RepID=A0A2Z2NM68_9GAMM|nr:sigma-70 family RNA polymerase sigma factor [Granulosicoccus antarcticus]ASJ72279.1 ECF RNA polymerase sigma factor SigK [Granulosicoccus antarcticus IMCC3135]
MNSPAIENDLPTLSDERVGLWLADVASGDRQALALLYKQVSARLFGLQLRILNNKALAEEALQETFVKVWKNSGTYNPDKGTPMAWLNSLARFQALDMRRRELVRHGGDFSKRSSLDVETFTSELPAIHEQLAQSELLSLCLGRLRPEVQQCIVAIYCEGYTQEEISTSVDRPLGTVKSWILRGLKSLKECFVEHN